MTAPPLVVILTAGMGAGHDQVAEELSLRLGRRGIASEVLDVWDLLPLRLGHLITTFYKSVMHYCPWLYEGIYAVWLRPDKRSVRASPLIWLAGRRLNRWMSTHRPAAAISTFHVCSQVLGHLRRQGRMPIETASMVVDFAAHGLWVDPDVDHHFCLHDLQADRLRSLGAPGVEAVGPVVSARFTGPETTAGDTRLRLHLPASGPLALVVAGSWGAGPVEATVTTIAGRTRYHPVVVAGRNERLRRRLASKRLGTVFGWVDRMDLLVRAADVVVENAGGLMAMEAMAVGTPVVSYRPIPGHGRENVDRMDAAGVSRYARSEQDLVEILGRLATDRPFREGLTTTAAGMFRSDLADHVAAMASRRPAL